ncbi:trypsin-like peptidase domain-containing protein [Clostridium sp. SM-530-WT-3G]|uniref:S1C family serine protease n=1 Tax=Clostridium sp. SM-530-WT-3G TaxID=2725303 RepID=UPI00145F10DB|nr:trypsin-like peptidase domain-containing protein [Clostridium sp. SM-530-WT-3G]NME82614.1 trypsin-like serine protease [Clostridium sp. SM-530-WT-3G]
MYNNENNNFIDVEASPVNEADQTVGGNSYNGNNNFHNKPKRKGKAKFLGKIAGLVIVAMAGGVFGSGITYYAMNRGTLGTSAVSKNVTYVPQSFTQSSDDAMSAADAFNKVSPAVVIISTVSDSGSVNMFGGTGEVEGMGSGFIINEDGDILTNYHVINGAKEIKVTLSDGREVNANVVNYDADKDIAMIKLAEGTKVPAVAELGDSDEIYPGAEVIAIGTPLSKNLAYTLTKGVVSGSNRSVDSGNGKSMNLIQTDAAINSGNSGGPLVNTKGQVIGINSMKLSSQASSSNASVEGIGFAIPINEVKVQIDTLSKQMVNLGIKIRVVDSSLSQRYNLEQGLYVAEVEEYSPAEKAGMKIGDIIVKCDGKTVTTFDELKEIKNSKNVGDTMEVEVIRNHKPVDLTVTLEEAK